jgi:hypothetical protein
MLELSRSETEPCADLYIIRLAWPPTAQSQRSSQERCPMLKVIRNAGSATEEVLAGIAWALGNGCAGDEGSVHGCVVTNTEQCYLGGSRLSSKLELYMSNPAIR